MTLLTTNLYASSHEDAVAGDAFVWLLLALTKIYKLKKNLKKLAKHECQG